MEQIINYRDIPTDKRLDILNALERIGFFPAYGGVKTMQQIMEKSVPGSGPPPLKFNLSGSNYTTFLLSGQSGTSTGFLSAARRYVPAYLC